MDTDELLRRLYQTGAMAVVIYLVTFLIGVVASVVGVGINALLAVGLAMTIVFSAIAFQSYRDAVGDAMSEETVAK
jgi:quinol-cytochrome oxidoreductase complex cytochrome b subunit